MATPRKAALLSALALIATSLPALGEPASDAGSTAGAVLAAGEDPLRTALPGEVAVEAVYPTLREGNRGEDVRAAQHLLAARGHTTCLCGAFDAQTREATRAFQSARGLTVDGIIGPQTWSALILTIREGAQGHAARALQLQLNAKHHAALSVDGIFGPGTTLATKRFQEHMRITADGIVGPQTWTHVLWHYARVPVSAALCDAHTPPAPRDRWGTGATAGQLAAAGASLPMTLGPLALRDVSREHGGAIPGHSDHQVGMDADVRPVRTDRLQCAVGVRWDNPAYDRAATRALVDAIRNTAPGLVKTILFNDPVLVGEGRTAYTPGHDDHLHVRFCAAAHPLLEYRC